MTILGSPGSGKGFYGRRLAQSWDVPLYSASQILKDSNALSADLVKSGQLLDCETVSATILAYLTRNHHNHCDSTTSTRKRFLMDGFPRTQRQVALMDDDWPTALHIPIALHLDVPDQVCVDKIVGRRLCDICHQEPNVADVQYGQFDLPPTRPPSCEDRCDPERHWRRRPDDESASVVLQRIADYRGHEKMLLESYRNETDDESSSSTTTTKRQTKKNAYSYTPYRGAKDYELLQQFYVEKMLNDYDENVESR
jgi:adenylate kinase